MDQRSIAALVARHTEDEEISETPVEGLRLLRISEPIERIPGVYPPSICCLVQGSKRASLGGKTYVYDRQHYLCASMPMPVEAEVPLATPDEPVLGLTLSLETRAMAETLVEYEAVAGPIGATRVTEPTPGLVVAHVDDAFTSAVGRLLELLDDPVRLRVLGDGRMRELLLSIIEGDAGPLIRRTFGASQDLSRALTYLRENLREPLSVDDLAHAAGMSRTVFHRRFKAATTFSPLQFIKALRLSEASMLIAQGQNVSQAADTVGYTSASQFSREFRRHFGKTPKQWGKTAANGASDVQATMA